jgi:hypothetical protein
MSTDFNWPKKGMKAFLSADDGEFFHLPSILMHFPQHAGAFKDVADLVVDWLVSRTDRGHHDSWLFPVAYLYRHCLELKLKDLVALGILHRFFEREEVQEVLDDHNLAKLWTRVRRLLEHRWPEADAGPLKGVEAAVNQFHQADPNGQVFRYERDKNTRRQHRHENLPDHISLGNLRKMMDAVYNLLEASDDALREDLSNMDY